MTIRFRRSRLLFVTQALDLDDPVLSVYHDWVALLASRVESVEVVCLKEGRHLFMASSNVRVHSLGKENGRPALGALTYALRFLRFAWMLRNRYNVAFVHMNQEYLLIAGFLWKVLGKRAYLWRNHYAGSWLTDLAAAFAESVFCTSRHSYTAAYRKTKLMPVGVNIEKFPMTPDAPHANGSVLFLARMAPSKRAEVLIDALALLRERGVAVTADFVGSPLPEHAEYYERLRKRASLDSSIRFFPGVPNSETSDLYAQHDIFVNCSSSGMYDKTIFEAAASGCLSVAASDDWKSVAGEELSFDGTASSLAARLETLLACREREKDALRARARAIAEAQSLPSLMDRLARELQ